MPRSFEESHDTFKKVLLVGITATTPLSGCGNDKKQDLPKDAEKDTKKVVEGSAKDIVEKSRKGYEEKKAAEAKREEVEIERFNTCDSQGKYCERGMLNIGSFNALKFGMNPEEVTQKLRRNAEQAVKTTMKDKVTGEDVEVIEYTFNAPMSTASVAFKDGALYHATLTQTSKRAGKTEFVTTELKQDEAESNAQAEGKDETQGAA